MPRATVSSDGEKFPLKSLLEGWVELRRMSFGQKQQRLAFASASIEMGGKKQQSRQMMLEMAQEKGVQFDFKTCIVDHNLEDADGRKLDLGSPLDFSLLDPRVGEEIQVLISNMNNFEEEEDDEGN